MRFKFILGFMLILLIIPLIQAGLLENILGFFGFTQPLNNPSIPQDTTLILDHTTESPLQFYIQSQTGVDKYYTVTFEDMGKNKTKIIYCIDDDKIKEAQKEDKLKNYKKPDKIKVKKINAWSLPSSWESDTKTTEIDSKAKKNKYCIELIENPYYTKEIKLGDNSTYIISGSQIFSNSLYSNVTAEGNFSHLTISPIFPFNNLIAYYPFDVQEVVTANKTYDYSQYNNDGTLTNGVRYNTTCLYGNCYTFDGVNDYINTVNSPSLNITNPNNFTILAWIKSNSSTTYQTIVNKGTNLGSDGFLFYLVSGNISYYSSGGGGWLYSPRTYKDNNWHLVGITHLGTNATIYADGIPVISGTRTLPIANNIGVTIGSTSNPLDFFNGSIDEVMIFNVSLNAGNITAIYRNQSNRFAKNGTQTIKSFQLTSNSSWFRITEFYQLFKSSNISMRLGYWNETYAYNNTNISALGSLVGYYHFDDLNWSNVTGRVNDSSGSKRNGTAISGAYTNLSGYFYRGGYFDGVDDYVNITITVPITTVCLWIKNSTNTGWTHIVYNGSVYIDGVAGTLADYPINISGNNTKIGVNGSTYFNGTIDEVMFYNRSLTQAEITELYIKGRALWKYTPYQNISSEYINVYKNISNWLLDYTFIAGNSTSFFYSPVIYSPTAVENLTIINTNDVATCGVIEFAGNYELISNITKSGTCLHILSNDIIVDCNGYTITGGIYNNGKSNFTLKNCRITGTGGVTLLSSNTAYLLNNTYTSCGTAISITNYNNITIANSTMFGGNNYGYSNTGGDYHTIDNINFSGSSITTGFYMTSGANNISISNLYMTHSGGGSINQAFNIYASNSINITNVTINGTLVSYCMFMQSSTIRVTNWFSYNNLNYRGFVLSATSGTYTNINYYAGGSGNAIDDQGGTAGAVNIFDGVYINNSNILLSGYNLRMNNVTINNSQNTAINLINAINNTITNVTITNSTGAFYFGGYTSDQNYIIGGNVNVSNFYTLIYGSSNMTLQDIIFNNKSALSYTVNMSDDTARRNCLENGTTLDCNNLTTSGACSTAGGCAWQPCNGTTTQNCTNLDSSSECSDTSPAGLCSYNTWCSGDFGSCSMIYSSEACGYVSGCSWDPADCSGTYDCTVYSNYNDCYVSRNMYGCSWDTADCYGFATACDSFDGDGNEASCTAQGCSSTPAYCSGNWGCNTYTNSGDCSSDIYGYGSCSWYSSDCSGFPSTCSTWNGDGEAVCTSHGCSWDTADCSGSGSCSSFDYNGCYVVGMNGCSWDSADCSGSASNSSCYQINNYYCNNGNASGCSTASGCQENTGITDCYQLGLISCTSLTGCYLEDHPCNGTISGTCNTLTPTYCDYSSGACYQNWSNWLQSYFINTTYDTNQEIVTTNCNLTRMWWYQARVFNDTSNLSNFDVLIYNNTNSLLYNLTTDANGLTAKINLTEYNNYQGVRTYFNNYTANTTFKGYSHNLTIEFNIFDLFNFTRLASSISLILFPSSPITYGTDTNATCISNGDGILKIYRDDVDITSENGFNVSLGAGTYNYTCNITIGSVFNSNSSSSIYVVNKATPSLVLTSSAGWTIPASTWSMISGTGCPTPLTCSLYESGVNVSNPFTDLFPAGSYYFEYNTTGNVNYTNASVWNTLIAQLNSSIINGTVGGTTLQQCRYKQLGYYNTGLVWIKEEGCV